MITNTEKRRAGFEAWAREHAHLGCLMQKADSFQEKFGATYHCPELEFAWQAWNAALDSVRRARCECEAIKYLYLENLRKHGGPI